MYYKKRKKDGIPLRDRKRKFKIFGIILLLIIFLALCILGGYFGSTIIQNIKSEKNKIETSKMPAQTQEKESKNDKSSKETESAAPPEYDFTFKETENSETKKGNLILVNENFGYKQDGSEGLVTVNTEKGLLRPDGDESFSVPDNKVALNKTACDKTIEMMDDFYKAQELNDILLVSGYRTNKEQQEIYDADLKDTGKTYSERVALPGHSEHETGLAYDLDLVEGEYDGSGKYDWINKNCKKYGFILRYPESKSKITNIEYETWHYRYVGMPAATYITDNDLCLEEFNSILQKYYSLSDAGSNILKVTGTDGKIYGIYYVAQDKGDVTFIPLPKDKDADISGSNTGGFIVTFDTGEKEKYAPKQDINAANYTASEGDTAKSTEESESIFESESLTDAGDDSSNENN